LAIYEYLAERHPNLWSADSTAHAHARSISAEMHGNFGAVREAMPMNVRGVGRRAPSSPDIDRDICRLAEIWTETRAQFGGGGDYLYGTFTNADAMFASVISR
jgi:glutathione S-transferase